MAVLQMKKLAQSPRDKILWELASHGGLMPKSDLARSVQMRQNELDAVLMEMEHAGKVKLTGIKGQPVVGLRVS